MQNFFGDFDDYLDYLTHLPGKLIIAGDFNIHVEDNNCPEAQKFLTFISNYGLVQHISEPTHNLGGTLDLVLTRSNSIDAINVSDIKVTKTTTTSDHFLVSFSCLFQSTKNSARIIKEGRQIKNIDVNLFKMDILESCVSDPSQFINCDQAAQMYNEELSKILDKHAPLKQFSIYPEQSKWLDSKCQEARRLRRKAERVYKRIGTAESKENWVNKSKYASTLIDSTRNNYYKAKLESASSNKKQAYAIVNQLLDRDLAKGIYPNDKPDNIVVTEMKDYFKSKVANIYSEFESNQCSNELESDNYELNDFEGYSLQTFAPLSEEELLGIISELNKKECEQDPIPLCLLLQCLNEVKDIILFIVNKSLVSGTFPAALKNAIVKPVIKDEKGDQNSYKNYRPISNLSFLSKIIEKSVHKQLSFHLDSHSLHADHQSGYRTHHSCETATLAIYNDLLCISDIKHNVVLLLLDLSSAFDTVNHCLLLKKLSTKFGLSGIVLKWFESYLKNRSFEVKINYSRSSRCFLCIGVPQGSILGPILFILYTKELEYIAKKHGFSIHLYADDTQLYIEFNPLIFNMDKIEARIIECIIEIKDWMTKNCLKINADKTKALVIEPMSYATSPNSISLNYNGDDIELSSVVRSLGILFDKQLTFEDQINVIIKQCNSQLRNLHVIASKLTFNLKKQLIHCLVLSKLDYCNGLYFGLPSYLINRLQKIQNSCVRFLFGPSRLKKWDHVTPYLKEAHFLPVKKRIEFKIALLVYKCLNNIAPNYLTKYIQARRQPVKMLRNDYDYFLLSVPCISNYNRTERSFKYAGPSVWNRLPYHVRTCNDINEFKSKLKTYLFTEAFS